MAYCWKHPSLIGLEVAWRWLFGIPALGLLYLVGAHIVAAHPLAPTGIYDLSLENVDQVEVTLANVWETLSPPLRARHSVGGAAADRGLVDARRGWDAAWCSGAMIRRCRSGRRRWWCCSCYELSR